MTSKRLIIFSKVQEEFILKQCLRYGLSFSEYIRHLVTRDREEKEERDRKVRNSITTL